jgi:hypothetical protein
MLVKGKRRAIPDVREGTIRTSVKKRLARERAWQEQSA